MLLNCGVGEDSGESPGLWGDQTSQSLRKSVLNIHWKDEYWSSNTFATWCFKELTPWKRPWCWERLKAGGEGGNREWDGWMASPTQWTWVWVSSRSWRRTGKPAVLQSMGWQKVGHDWMTARDQAHVSCIARWILNNWTSLKSHPLLIFVLNVGIGLHSRVLCSSLCTLFWVAHGPSPSIELFGTWLNSLDLTAMHSYHKVWVLCRQLAPLLKAHSSKLGDAFPATSVVFRLAFVL